MNRLQCALGLASTFTLSLSMMVVACTAPDFPERSQDPLVVNRPSSTPPESDPEAVDSGTGPAMEPTPAQTEGGTTPAPASCASTADYKACFACCDAPTGGALARAEQAYQDCSCNGGACATVCSATYCSNAKASADCSTCLASSCDTIATCTTAACQAASQCLKTSDCGSKP